MMEPGFEPRLVWFGNMNCKHCAVATARLLIIKWKYLSSGGTTAYSPGQCIPDFGGTWKPETLIGSSLSGAGMRLGLPGAFTPVSCPGQYTDPTTSGCWTDVATSAHSPFCGPDQSTKSLVAKYVLMKSIPCFPQNKT